jgi:hypothetical protein
MAFADSSGMSDDGKDDGPELHTQGELMSRDAWIKTVPLGLEEGGTVGRSI